MTATGTDVTTGPRHAQWYHTAEGNIQRDQRKIRKWRERARGIKGKTGRLPT